MTVKYHHHIEQGSHEWHELRRGIITASTAGKLITATGKVAANDTVRQTAFQMAAERITGRVEPMAPTYHMEWGLIEEVFARDLYSEHYTTVNQCGFIENDYLGFKIGYSPDGLVGDDGLIEIKSRMAKYQVQTILTQDVPAEYMIQLQFGMMVTGRPWIDFIQYSNGMALYVQRVTPDAVMIEAIEEAVSLFEERVRGIMDEYKTKSANLHVADYIQHIDGSEIETND